MDQSTIPSPVSTNYVSGGRLVTWVIWLLVLPLLLFSSTEFVALPRLVALAACLLLYRRSFPNGLDLRMKAALAAVGVVLAASWTGSRTVPQPVVWESLLGVGGFISICGMTVLLAVVLSHPEWCARIVRVLAVVMFVLMVTSLVAYFLPIDRLIPMGDMAYYFEHTRLFILWPSRLLMGWCGQIGWAHANHAGLMFGLGLIFSLNLLLSGRARRKVWWWSAVVLLGTCVFLTGSRSSFLMLLACLPWLWWGRSWKMVCLSVAALAGSVAIGISCLRIKEGMIFASPSAEEQKLPEPVPQPTEPVLQPTEPVPQPTEPVPQPTEPVLQPTEPVLQPTEPVLQPTEPPVAPPPTDPSPVPPPERKDVHLKGIIERGASGRIDGYTWFWRESIGFRIFGRGLTENPKRMIHLNQEHSSFVATFRGGGAVALAAHLLLLTLSAWCAVVLFFREGIRWPLLLLSATTAALLFDRSSVFYPGANYELPLHWIAVLSPLLLRRPPQPSVPDPAGMPVPPP